jgi:hypothetical protein
LLDAPPGTGHVAPVLQAVQEVIKREKLAQVLERKIDSRPEREDLEQKNILKGTTVAPALQATRLELEKGRIADTLETKMATRPDRSDLLEKGVLENSSDNIEPHEPQ